LRKSAVLQTSHLPGSHTAALIKDTICRMLDSWNLASKVHVVLRDNAKNVTKAMDDAQIKSLGCTAHTLQLALKEALESQRAIEDAVAVCRRDSRALFPLVWRRRGCAQSSRAFQAWSNIL